MVGSGGAPSRKRRLISLVKERERKRQRGEHVALRRGLIEVHMEGSKRQSYLRLSLRRAGRGIAKETEEELEE